MPELHPACQEFANAIAELQREAALLAEDLKTAAPGQKPAIAAQIKKINQKIAAQQKLLDACIQAHPQPAPVVSTLTGRAGIWRSPTAAGYFTQITLGMTFYGWNSDRVKLAFPTLVFPRVLAFSRWGISYTADLVVSMTSDGIGSYDPKSHHLNIPLALRLTPSGVVGFLGSLISLDPSTISLFPPGLTTHTLPSTLDPQNRLVGIPPVPVPGAVAAPIRLVGEGRASGGYCMGWGLHMEIEGSLQPLP
jgi:hypothetical protein